MIGVIILNYNTWEDAAACIESLDAGAGNAAYRIYLVDNASPKLPSEEFLKFLAARDAVFLQNKENLGWAGGNNVGISQAMADGCQFFFICNSDVRFQKGSLEVMEQYLKAHPEVGIAGPKIRLADGQIQRECMAVKTGVREKYVLRTRLHVLFPGWNKRYWGRNHDYERETFPVYAVLGCCFLMSRACAEAVLPFDEGTFLYEEELILGIRMEEAGWKTVYCPKAEIVHLHERSTGGVRKSAFAYSCNVASEIYYCRKYLHMAVWQIRPLYWYRTALFWARHGGRPGFREKWKVYRKRTGKEFR